MIEPENGQSIACLFTSDRTGAYKLPPDQIVHYTDLAMRDLVRQLQESSSDQKVTMSLPKINAGLFAVPWEQTEEVLKKYTDDLNIEVFEL